jgi:hypothetical protein
VSTTPDQSLTAATARAAQALAQKLGFLDIPGGEIALTSEAVTISLEANVARSLAARLGFPPSTWDARHPRRHRWYGVRDDLDVYVVGHGYLAEQVPDRLVADVLAPPVPVAYFVPAKDYRSTEDVADITPADTAGL